MTTDDGVSRHRFVVTVRSATEKSL